VEALSADEMSFGDPIRGRIRHGLIGPLPTLIETLIDSYEENLDAILTLTDVHPSEMFLAHGYRHLQMPASEFTVFKLEGEK